MKALLLSTLLFVAQLVSGQNFISEPDSIQTGKFAEGVKAKVVKDKMFFIDAS